jgi:hypothetical protein
MNSWNRGFTTFSSGDNRYQVELWIQPWPRRVIAAAYHWYDMRIFKVPGFHLLERWLESRHHGDDLYIPLSAEQDCRCYYLSQRDKTVVARLDIDEDTYNKMPS